jgi:hypothetical protein
MLVLICASFAGATAPTFPQSFETELYLSLRPTNDPIEFADMNGDGFKDILFSRLNGGFRVGWTENGGHGSFTKSRFLTDYPASNGPYTDTASAADLDGDGDSDLLVIATFLTPGRREVGWHENLGGGEFGPFQMIANTAAGFGGEPIVQGLDLDADGDEDVLFSVDDGGPTWLANQGGGTFGPPVDLAPNGEKILQLEISDLDGDGRTDIVWNTRFRNEVTWARNLGGGLFAPASVIRSFNGAYSFAATDFDADGLSDLVVAEPLGLVWLRNLGSGTFGAPVSIASNLVATEMTAGDFDGDGLSDIVTWGPSSGPTWFHRNAGAGTLMPRVDLGSDSESSLTQLLTEDVDTDGDLDVVVSSSTLQWHENTGATVPSAGQPLSRRVTGTLADIDGDGDLDCIGTDAIAEAVVLFINRSDAEFSTPSPIITGVPGPAGVDAADADNDGDLDLLVSSAFLAPNSAQAWVYEGVGGGYAAGRQVFPANVQNDGDVDAEWLDMDGDGDSDVLMVFSKPLAAGNLSLVWSRNDGVLGFTPGQVDPLPLLEGLIDVVDFDGDGLADIVGRFSMSAGLSWRQGMPGGSFGAPISTGLGATSAGGVELVDLNGDLALDVLYIDSAADEVRVSFQAGAGGFGPSQTVVNLPLDGFSITAADWDLDGDADPAVSVATSFNNPNGQLIVIDNLGGGSFGGTTTFETGSVPGPIFGADVDGDQDIDLWRGPLFSGYSLLLNERRIGDAYCGNGAPNSTGEVARISAEGSSEVALNDVTLLASGIPRFAFGYFLLSDETSFLPGAGGSQGTLCLGGDVGRLNRGPNEVFQADATESVAVPLDLTNIPTSMGSVAILPGDTRYFQAWHRDANPFATSNFTTGLTIQFE